LSTVGDTRCSASTAHRRSHPLPLLKQRLIASLPIFSALARQRPAAAYVDADEHEPDDEYGEVDEEQIVEGILAAQMERRSPVVNATATDEKSGDEDEAPEVRPREAQRAIETLRLYLQQSKDETTHLFPHISVLLEKIKLDRSRSMTQTNIRDHFMAVEK